MVRTVTTGACLWGLRLFVSPWLLGPPPLIPRTSAEGPLLRVVLSISAPSVTGQENDHFLYCQANRPARGESHCHAKWQRTGAEDFLFFTEAS